MKRISYYGLFLSLLLGYINLFAADYAIIILYHRFGDERYPSTNITLEQFDRQIEILQQDSYQVLPIPDIVERLQKGQSLPDKTVGIAIDDAYATLYTNAWPRLKKAGFPFTIFVSTDAIDKNYSDMMTWKQLKELADQGVSIENHTATHSYLEYMSTDAVQADINKAQQRITLMTGKAPTLFAYPYGEYDADVVKVVKRFGFKAAFTQISGPIGSQSNVFLLSRFPLNEHYGIDGRFKMILETLPLYISNISPNDTMIKNNNPPTIQFKVVDSKLNLKNLACYATEIGPLKVTLLDNQRVEVTSPQAFGKGRTHINCTLPAPNKKWYWVSMLYVV